MRSQPDAPLPADPHNARDIAIRLAFSCWLIFSLHFATNMVRENYLALAIGDELSFRVDPYANLHDDIFETPDRGWHIGSNPGASMLGAVPYALSRPILDRIVERAQRARQAAGPSAAPAYDAPTAKDRLFYEEAWRRGLDVKFGLASFVMQSLAMAVTSALGVVCMYFVLLGFGLPAASALGFAFLYAFGTPVLFRTGFLNHNLMLAHAGLAGFAVLGPWPIRVSEERRFLLAGLAGGTALLLDYSGAIFLAGLWVYGLLRARERQPPARLRLAGLYALGALVPILLLWFYQWRSFGHPFLPPQHWMPPVEWSDQGYQGVALPQAQLAAALAFDYRYGLFISCPLFLLALALPFLKRRVASLPRGDLITCFVFTAAFFLFFSSVHYTRWQFNTGVRYLAPVFPFLFLPAALVLRELPALARRLIVIGSVSLAWCMAMARDVSGGKVDLADPDTGLGVLDPVIAVLTGGFQLPALTTLSRMQAYVDTVGARVSALPLLGLTAAVLLLVWWPNVRGMLTPGASLGVRS
jgi:hypothetical protein